MNLAISKVDADDLSLTTPINDLTTREAISEAICQSNWSPILFKDGKRRGENFQGSWLIVFDVDAGLPISLAKQRLINTGVWHILGTTKSHRKLKHVGDPYIEDRYRIVLKLDEFIHDWGKYRATWDYYREELFPESDDKAGLSSQFFYSCCEITSQLEGSALSTREALLPSIDVPQLPSPGDPIGSLSTRSLRFLVTGAPDGQWNGEIFLAARDAMEQGWELDSFEAAAAKITGHLDAADHASVKSAYARPAGNELRKLEPEKEVDGPTAAQLDSYSLFQELGKTTDFLSNKLNTEGFKTGFALLDEKLGNGLLPRYFTGLTAPGKTGKTTFITQLAFNLAQQGTKVGIMSLEMSPFRHMIPSILSIGFKMNLRTMEPGAIKKLTDSVPSTLPFLDNIHFLNRMGVTRPDVLIDWIKYQHEVNGVEVFMLDHVGYSLEDIADRKQHSALSKALRKVTDSLHIIPLIYKFQNHI